MSFEALGLSDPLVRGVRAAGYRSTTAIQSEAIPHILAGRDLFGVSKTGSGKTAAFCLPMLQRLSQLAPVAVPHGTAPSHRRTRALILSPTRESATQIGERLKVYGQQMPFTHVVLHSGGNHAAQTLALRNGVDILVATPGWLHELMVQGYVYLTGLQFVVIDEADRMLQAGMQAFLTSILRALPMHRQSVLFAETPLEQVLEFAATFLKHPLHVGYDPPKPKRPAKGKGPTAATPAKGVRKPVAPPAKAPAAAPPAAARIAKAKGAAKAPPAAAPPKGQVRTAAPAVVRAKVATGKSSGVKPAPGKPAGAKPKTGSGSGTAARVAKPKSALSKATKLNGGKGKQARSSARGNLKARVASRGKGTSTKSAARGRSA